MEQPIEQSHNPDDHARNILRMLEYVRNHCRQDIDRVDQPEFQALLESAAEVLGGLCQAFKHRDTHTTPMCVPQEHTFWQPCRAGEEAARSGGRSRAGGRTRRPGRHIPGPPRTSTV